MSDLEERIFPSMRPPSPLDMRMELVSSWESQLIGIGRLTAFLTPRLLRQSHAVDDMGLSVMFLQRHRVEVGLKLVLERCDVRIPNKHNIMVLIAICRDACAEVGVGAEWAEFEAKQLEFMTLMHEVDPSAAAWRFPVDRVGRPAERRPYVDLEALEEAAAAFETRLRSVVARLAQREPLPVGEEEADETARELREVAAASITVLRTSALILESARGDRPAGERLQPRGDHADVLAASSAVNDVAVDLARRAEEMAERIEHAHGLAVWKAPVPPVVPPMPRLTLAAGTAASRALRKAQINWAGQQFAEVSRPLGNVLIRLQVRTAGWSTPAARQVKLDIVRFRSRFHTNWHKT